MGKVELFGIEVNELKPKAAKGSKSKGKQGSCRVLFTSSIIVSVAFGFCVKPTSHTNIWPQNWMDRWPGGKEG